MVAPTPSNELTQLLEDQQVEDTSRGHFVIIIVWYAVPMKALQSLGERKHEGDGKGVGIAENLETYGVTVSLTTTTQ